MWLSFIETLQRRQSFFWYQTLKWIVTWDLVLGALHNMLGNVYVLKAGVVTIDVFVTNEHSGSCEYWIPISWFMPAAYPNSCSSPLSCWGNLPRFCFLSSILKALTYLLVGFSFLSPINASLLLSFLELFTYWDGQNFFFFFLIRKVIFVHYIKFGEVREI